MRCRAVPPCSRYFFLQRDAGSSTCRPTNPRGVQPSPEEPLETPTDPQHRAEMLAAERAKRLEKHEQMRALIAWLVEHRFAGKQVDLCPSATLSSWLRPSSPDTCRAAVRTATSRALCASGRRVPLSPIMAPRAMCASPRTEICARASSAATCGLSHARWESAPPQPPNERLLRSKPARPGRHGLRSAKAVERRHGMRCMSMNMSSVHSFMSILG